MRYKHRNIAEQRLVDLVPIVNVVLLLISFFLMSWSFVLPSGVGVRLGVDNFLIANQQGHHVITLKSIAKDNVAILFNEKIVDFEKLREHLKTAAEKTPGDRITINADDSVPNGLVQQALSLAMEYKFQVTMPTLKPAIPTTKTP